MVAYDVLWKFSRLREYADIQASGNRVTKWITLGCPLGEAGVQANLRDAREHVHEDCTDKHPQTIIKDWVNIAAHDDFIAHDATMKDDFSDMLKFGQLESIKDKKMYNCFAMNGRANPHKFYGYLVNPIVAREIVQWMS